MTSYNTFKASIPSFSTSRDEKKPFTLYNLVFQLGEQTWNTSVRYSTIRALHEAVKLKYPSIKVPKLPGKKLVGNDNAEFIEKRRAKLEQYLQELLSFPLVRGSPEVMQYFNLNSRIGLVPRAFTMYSPSSPIAPGSGSGIQSPQSRQPSSQQRGMNRGGASSSKSIRAIALYDYSTEEEDPTADLLPFSANDTIKDIILDDDGSGWYYGTLEMNGTKGFFPGNYVKILQDGAEEEEVPATAAAASSSAVASASSSATFAATGAVGAAGTAVAASAAAHAAQRNASAVSRQQQPQQPQITTMARGGTMIGSREPGVGSPGRVPAAQNKQPFGPKIAGVDRAALGGNRPSAKTVVSPTSPRAVLESGSGILAPTAPAATTATASSNKGGSAIFAREAPSASSDIKVSPASPSGSAIHAKAWAEGNPNESKRTNIAMEIVATEEKYVENLSWLCKDYYEALEKLMKEGHSALNPEVLKAVFCNSLTILNLNQGLLADLQAIRKSWSDETTLLGQAFRKWIPFMKMYKEYGNNFDRANEMCNKLREHGQIVAVLDATKNRCQQLTLDALLITPIQRLPRYNLLLTDLLRNTPESHPDYQNIKAALEEMSAVADSINESIKEAEQSRKFGHLAQRGAGFGVLLEAHRRLVMEAKFATKQGVKSKTIQLHLFNDVLVPARITRNEANPVIVIPLNLTWLAEDEDPASTSFTVISPDQPFTFFAESVVEKNKWRAAILEGIKNNLQPLQGLLESDAKTTNDNLAFRFGDYEYMDGGAYQGAWNVGMRHGIGRLTYFSGNVYDGAWHSNLRHGVGTLTYITGEVYEGQWEKDRPNGTGKLLYNNKGDVYEGAFKDGRRHGKGVITFANGDVFEGVWQNDKAHGKCTLKYAHGAIFDGMYDNDKQNGIGMFKTKDGRQYQGNYMDHKRHGSGVQTYNDGCVYTGHWYEDQRHGTGELKEADGAVYQGEWNKDKKEGQGKMIYSNGDMYEGWWKEDKPNGHGLLKTKAGHTYEGEWLAGKRNGKGVIIYANGDKYEGTWHMDQYHNTGTFTSVDGTKLEGKWANGRLEGKCSLAPHMWGGKSFTGTIKDNSGIQSAHPGGGVFEIAPSLPDYNFANNPC